MDKHRGQDCEQANKVWLGLGISGLLQVCPSPGEHPLVLATTREHVLAGLLNSHEDKLGVQQGC